MENYPEGEIREVGSSFTSAGNGQHVLISNIPYSCTSLSSNELFLQMIDIYVAKGMSKEDATLVITTMSKYKDFFVDVMMQQELELQVRLCCFVASESTVHNVSGYTLT